MKNFKALFFMLAVFFLPSFVFSYSEDELDDSIILETESFFKAIGESDAAFIGQYIQGGKTRAKVKVIKPIFGNVGEEEIVKNLENEKIRKRYRIAPLQSGENYFFLVQKSKEDLNIHPSTVTFQIIGNKANFSFAAPYLINFWQLFDQKVVEIIVKSIKENATGAIPEESITQINTLFAEYLKNNDYASVKALISGSYYLGIKLDEALFLKALEDQKTLGCIAVKFSAKIMGRNFYNDKVFSKIKSLTPDQQIATVYAAIDADAKNTIPVFAQMLQQLEYYEPPSSECFPEVNPPSNKIMFSRAIIEIESQESLSILAKELKTENTPWLSKLLKLIAQYEGDDLIELVLNAAIQEKFSERKIEFANYFDKVKTPEAEKSLKRLFEKAKDAVGKKFILSILGKYKYQDSLSFLTKVINEDTNEEVRASAAIAIGRLDSKDGLKPLFDFVMREKSILAKTIGIDAIAEIRDKAAQDYLNEIIKLSDNQKVKEKALSAKDENLFILRYGRKEK